MAVPKKKTSKSRRNMRRSHLAVGRINVVIDAQSGEYRLPHHICAFDGTYKNRRVVVKEEKVEQEENV